MSFTVSAWPCESISIGWTDPCHSRPYHGIYGRYSKNVTEYSFLNRTKIAFFKLTKPKILKILVQTSFSISCLTVSGIYVILFILIHFIVKDSALIKAIWRDLLRKILTQSSVDTATQSPLKRSPSMFTPYSKPQDVKTKNRSSTLQLIELTLQDCLSRFGSRFLDDPSTNHLKCSIYFPLSKFSFTEILF